jgi:NADH-quinone oxidoreductase subunit F
MPENDEPLLTKYIREPNCHTLAFYEKTGGYQALKKALGMAPEAVIDAVKASVSAAAAAPDSPRA